jgi:hypothetical protein
MQKKRGFLSVMAALTLAIFTFAAVPAGADPLPGSKWLGILGPKGYSGPSLLEFTTAGNATGNFGDSIGRVFTYTLDPGETSGVLVETTTLYKWSFILSGNDLTFPNGLAPYGQYNVSTTFDQITFPSTPVTLNDLTGTNWLGVTNKGETLLDNIAYDLSFETGTLDCTTSPYWPVLGLDFEYTYNGGGGTGKVDMLGDFTTYNNTATMVFDDFMYLGPAATFRLFEYLP